MQINANTGEKQRRNKEEFGEVLRQRSSEVKCKNADHYVSKQANKLLQCLEITNQESKTANCKKLQEYLQTKESKPKLANCKHAKKASKTRKQLETIHATMKANQHTNEIGRMRTLGNEESKHA